ncbi:hypothetical protein CPLU01_00472 [Colletotrichum plurivorum]|uniref:Uncharacterized protein n=1 Tax=Colletotrichum plurivorum TaxID=2175906 RepID=A0A8H6U5W8_9PEZI|nr:hypothetical protein CPLU01_00472 [Colletotrichum plurivorum]
MPEVVLSIPYTASSSQTTQEEKNIVIKSLAAHEAPAYAGRHLCANNPDGAPWNQPRLEPSEFGFEVAKANGPNTRNPRDQSFPSPVKNSAKFDSATSRRRPLFPAGVDDLDDGGEPHHTRRTASLQLWCISCNSSQL